MIIRVFRAVVRPGMAAMFEARTREASLPTVRTHPGLIAFFPGRPLDESTGEFVMITVWDSLASVEAFTGPNWRRTVIPSEEQPLLQSCTVEHYEFYGDPTADLLAPAARGPVKPQ
jgi:heme-degrading monooxygenase HmoA